MIYLVKTTHSKRVIMATGDYTEALRVATVMEAVIIQLDGTEVWFND
jgi:hypothetical protein